MPLYKAAKEAFSEETDRQFAELAKEEPERVSNVNRRHESTCRFRSSLLFARLAF